MRQQRRNRVHAHIRRNRDRIRAQDVERSARIISRRKADLAKFRVQYDRDVIWDMGNGLLKGLEAFGTVGQVKHQVGFERTGEFRRGLNDLFPERGEINPNWRLVRAGIQSYAQPRLAAFLGSLQLLDKRLRHEFYLIPNFSGVWLLSITPNACGTIRACLLPTRTAW